MGNPKRKEAACNYAAFFIQSLKQTVFKGIRYIFHGGQVMDIFLRKTGIIISLRRFLDKIHNEYNNKY